MVTTATVKQIAIVTVIGADKTGVIARVTHFLFEHKANIEALEEQVTRGKFSMTLEASWKTEDWNRDQISSQLAQLGTELGMEIKIRPIQRDRIQRMAILVTKEPHCLRSLMEGVQAGRLKAE